MNFADRLVAACAAKDSVVCVGIDPRLDAIPAELLQSAIRDQGETPEAAASAVLEFSKRVIDVTAEDAVAVKPQVAFFERLGPAGMQAYHDVIGHAHARGLLVISDIKRSDIGSTAEAYADGHLGSIVIGSKVVFPWRTDAVTVSPYLGSDGLRPFIREAMRHQGGVFALVKTSNPSSVELQDLKVDGRPIYERVAAWLAEHAPDLMGDSGYSSLGAVVGVTFPQELERLRAMMPRNILLIPGYGAQGGTAADAAPAFNDDGLGAIVNASRSVIFAYGGSNVTGDWGRAVAVAARKMREELNRVRK
jgi:orotidine-5'-phosphate decarboxylase